MLALRRKSPPEFGKSSGSDDRLESRRSGTTQTGLIEEVLPNQMYRVRLDDGKTVRAGVSPSLRHSVVRLIAGSRVAVKLTSHDPNRGQIVKQM